MHAIPLKRVANLRGEKIDTVSGCPNYVGLEHIESHTGKAAPNLAGDCADGSGNVFQRGDVLFGKLRPYLAKAWLADVNGVCTTEALVLQPRGIEPRYLRYFLLAPTTIAAVDAATSGAKMPRADWDFVGQLSVPVTELYRQTAIANYLDAKTAAIDALIAKKELLIEELRKYQEAVIAEAVGAARATDPLVKLKRLFKERSARGFTNEPPLAATQHAGVVPKASLAFKTMESRLEDYSTYKLVCPDDFVISLRSFEGGLELSKYRGVVSPAYTVLEPGELVHPDYFKYALKSKYFVDSLGVHKRGIREGQSVPWSALGEDEIRVPTIESQESIAEQLGIQVGRFSATVAAAESLVAELKAYRAALISEAVTGKISM